MKPIKELSISGGGVRGYGFFGSIYYLWKEGILQLDKLETIACVSIGSWIGAALTLGYTPVEMGDFFFDLDVGTVKDIDLSNFFERKSMLKGEVMRHFIKKLVTDKYPENITLLELHRKTKIHLIIVTLCLNTSKVIYLDHLNNPDLDLITAIVMSSSIPGLFPPVEYQNKLYIDGGLVDNNPIHILGDEAWGICQSVDETENKIDVKNMMDYSVYIIRSIYNNVNNVKRKSNQKIISIKTDISITSFDLNKDVKLELIQKGINETQLQVNRLGLIESVKNIIHIE